MASPTVPPIRASRRALPKGYWQGLPALPNTVYRHDHAVGHDDRHRRVPDLPAGEGHTRTGGPADLRQASRPRPAPGGGCVARRCQHRLLRGQVSGASDSVLEALARALHLDVAERGHLFDLAHAANPTGAPRCRRPTRPESPSSSSPSRSCSTTPPSRRRSSGRARWSRKPASRRGRHPRPGAARPHRRDRPAGHQHQSRRWRMAEPRPGAGGAAP
jgi:hypothetical protein